MCLVNRDQHPTIRVVPDLSEVWQGTKTNTTENSPVRLEMVQKIFALDDGGRHELRTCSLGEEDD